MMINKSWLGRQRKMSLEGSTQDLIDKSSDSSPERPTITDTTPSVLIEIPRDVTNKFKKRRKLVNKSVLILALVLLLLVVILMCLYFHEKYTLDDLKNKREKTSVCVTSGCVEAAAFMQSAIDKTINPCEDFYLYSCAGWIKNNPIPTGESMWDTISVVAKRNVRVLKNILEDTRVQNQSDVTSKAEYNAYKMYKSCKDLKRIGKLGIQPLVSLMNDVANFVPPNEDASHLKHDNMMDLFLALYDKANLQPFFSISVGHDDKNSSSNILQFKQSGLSLAPYIYNETVKENEKIIQEFIKYTASLGSAMDKVIKSKDAFVQMAKNVYDFEKSLKKIFVQPKDMVTIDQVYEKITIRELQKISSNKINWFKYVQNMFKSTGIQITENEPIVVYSMPYFKRLKQFMDTIDMVTVNNYVVFHLLSTYSSFITEDILELRKNLTIAMRGTYKKLERWKRCVSVTDSAIGMALGALFVKESFTHDSYTEANRLVESVKKSFIDGFKSLSWIDDATRSAAEDKARSIVQKIGYPSHILIPEKLDEEYKGLHFNEDEFFRNILNDSIWATHISLQKLRKPVDVKEWYMTPPTVNAYYEPTENEIVFPAGILQPPYFKFSYPKSVNYGMMGSIIGHEITHGFDNNGRQYDKHGNFIPSWWSQSVIDEYMKKTKCFVEEYSKFKLKDAANHHIKGNLTLGENIADNGGLKASYKAYQNYIKEKGEEPTLPGVGVTNEQAFFISYAQSWCTEELTQVLIHQIETDSHSPAIERVRGSVQNNEDFARAFQCPVGSVMNPKKKCTIW